MTFYINFEVIPRTLSGQNRIEDQRWCKQNIRTKTYIKSKLSILGVGVSVNERCLHVGFEGYGSNSWNRNLPEFMNKDYGIDYWPLIWPENLINRQEFELTFRNRSTGEEDTFHFQRIIRVSPSIEGKKRNYSLIVENEEDKQERASPKKDKQPTSRNWEDIKNGFPEYKKWIATGTINY